ncbi:GNAT family N-acetyltransferase [Streptomyces sp. CA-251247]|uniref:GNAT family N-acetyltransferase n=1 Tax=Streptomyces sp. CA-251247 TaxID=3240062 RepID=UPI003D933362
MRHFETGGPTTTTGSLSVLPSAAPAQVRVIEGPLAHTFLTTRWAGLFQQDSLATPYQAPGWLSAHADQLPLTATLMILVAENDTGPRAALAVVRDRTAGGWLEVTPLSTPMAEYVRIVGPDAEDPAVAASLAEALTRLDADVMLPDVPATSALGRYISSWRHGLTRCARITLPVPYAAMSRSTRRDHRRRRRDWAALATRGHTIDYHRTQSAAELSDAYAALAHLHRRRWRASGPEHRVTAADGRLRTVLERCPESAFIATLSLDGKPVAAQLCLYRDRHAYSMLPAMDLDHEDLAPGHALLRHLTDDLTAAGFVSLDLGRTTCAPGQVAYKQQYAPIWSATVTAVRRTLPFRPDEM